MKLNKISSMGRMGLAHKHFGNPIPQQAYDLIDAVEEALPEYNLHLNQLLTELQRLVTVFSGDGGSLYTTQTKREAIEKARAVLDKVDV